MVLYPALSNKNPSELLTASSSSQTNMRCDLIMMTKVLTYSVFRAIAGRIFDAIVAGIHVLKKTSIIIDTTLIKIDCNNTPGSGGSLC